jgi:hypothetical protein
MQFRSVLSEAMNERAILMLAHQLIASIEIVPGSRGGSAGYAGTAAIPRSACAMPISATTIRLRSMSSSPCDTFRAFLARARAREGTRESSNHRRHWEVILGLVESDVSLRRVATPAQIALNELRESKP